MCQRNGHCYHPMHIFSYAACQHTTVKQRYFHLSSFPPILSFSCSWDTFQPFFPPLCLPFITCSCSLLFSAESANMVQHFSRRHKCGTNVVFFHFGWLPVVLGLIPFPLCPLLPLMWGIRLTQHNEIYQWLQLLKSVARMSQHLKGSTKHHSFSFHVF